MATSSWARLLARAFPRLSSETFEIVAQPSIQYNCIAYAAGDASEWWGFEEKDYYWPDYATRSDSIESLVEVFAGLGFEQCQDSSLESGYEKVALYEVRGVWTHAAVQMGGGHWRSKVWVGPVIEHLSPESISGGIYGNPTIYMRRARNATATCTARSGHRERTAPSCFASRGFLLHAAMRVAGPDRQGLERFGATTSDSSGTLPDP